MRRVSLVSVSVARPLVAGALTIACFAGGSTLAGCDTTLNLGDGDAAIGASPDAAPARVYGCPEVCARLVDTCDLAPVSQRQLCLDQCTLGARQSDLACVMTTPCFAIASTCGRGNGGSDGSTDDPADAGDPEAPAEIANCQAGCDHAIGIGCFTAAQHAQCRSLCTTASSAARTAFYTCSFSGGGECSRQTDCYATFSGD